MIENFLSSPTWDELYSSDQLPGSLGHFIEPFRGNPAELEGVELAILGVGEERLDGLNAGTAQGADIIRRQLYRLMRPQEMGRLVDLGNIRAGESVSDTLFAMQTVLLELQSRKIRVIVLGGDERLALRQYEVMKEKSDFLRLAYVGRRVDFRENSLLFNIVLDEPPHLFNLTALAYQTYLTEQASLDALERMFFESVRLGVLRNKMELAEPVFRDADLAIFDCSSIKQGDFPAFYDPSPNGLRAEEACQMTRYAGLGSELDSIGFYNYNPRMDRHDQGARLIAQMVWFFVEAHTQRRLEDPLSQPDNFYKYRLADKNNGYEMVFYKSRLSDRWWMELPHPQQATQNTRPIHIPCAYEDYQLASNGEMPDRWWRFYQKYSL